MLQKLTNEIAECYRRAHESREAAKRTSDPSLKQDLLDMERRWISLAHSYEFAERLSNFTAEVRRSQKGVESLADPLKKLRNQ